MQTRSYPTAPSLFDALRANPQLGSPASPSRPRVTIVVPIYNAFDELQACLLAVADCTDSPFRLALINDGSPDPRISSLLAEAPRDHPGLLIVDRSTENRGFVHTANEGLAAGAPDDVVILNTDTLVSPGWLRRILRAAASRPNVATVTPLTNNGTICSVPQPFRENDIPRGYDVRSFAAVVEASSWRVYPEIPTGVGFCMLMTRKGIESVGVFDEQTFGRGYGEENDFCQRALARGFVNVIADDAFVYHKGHASFGRDASDRLSRNLAILNRRYPHYDSDIAAVVDDHPLRPFHEYLEANTKHRRTAEQVLGNVRVLHVLHRGGGTDRHARELAAIDDPDIVSFVSSSDGTGLDVDEYWTGHIVRSLRFPLPRRLDVHVPFEQGGYRSALTVACRSLGITLIHVHHLRHNTVDIAAAARSLGIPFVMTLHDYHAVCPTFTLLGAQGQPCGACMSRDDDASRECLASLGETPEFLERYQRAMTMFLSQAAALFVPSGAAKAVVLQGLPALADTIVVREHGHAGALLSASPATRTAATAALNVAIIGGIDLHKGSSVLRGILRGNERNDVVFHLYGTTSDATLRGVTLDREVSIDGSRFVYHGPYVASEICDRLNRDGIDIGLHLSVWAETFSYTLSEFAQAGIPVIVGRLGAQGERTARHALGWVVPDIRDTRSTLAVLSEVAQAPERLAAMRKGMRVRDAVRPLEEMWAEYANTYRSLSRGNNITMHDDYEDSVDERRYVQYLATCLAEHRRRAPDSAIVDDLHRQVHTLEELLRSPRHRAATLAGDALQRVPLMKPFTAWLTKRLLSRGHGPR